MNRLLAVALGTLCGLVPLIGSAQATEGPHPQAPEETIQYSFILGDWHLEAKTMRPDRTFNKGTGTVKAYYIHDGFTLQADMHVTFEDGTGFRGSTLRTYNPSEGKWAVTWVPAGAPIQASGAALWEGDRMVETFPASRDQFGVFTDTLVLFNISEDHFTVSMDRYYTEDDLLVEGVWQYEARRMK